MYTGRTPPRSPKGARKTRQMFGSFGRRTNTCTTTIIRTHADCNAQTTEVGKGPLRPEKNGGQKTLRPRKAPLDPKVSRAQRGPESLGSEGLIRLCVAVGGRPNCAWLTADGRWKSEGCVVCYRNTVAMHLSRSARLSGVFSHT